MKKLLLLAFTVIFSMPANSGHHAENKTSVLADPRAVVVVENGKIAAFTAFEDTDSMCQAMVTQ